MKWMKGIFCLLLSGVFFLAAACSGGEKTVEPEPDEIRYTDSYLVKDGKSIYSVLLPESPTPAEEFAAQELCGIFYNSTGVTLPVANEPDLAAQKYISIGDTEAFGKTGIRPETLGLGGGGFVLKTLENNVYINADTEQGKIYGVYELCERNLGYRYFAADEIRYVPTQTALLQDFDLTVVPSFDGRNVNSYYNSYDHLNALRLRVNEIGSTFPEQYGEASDWATLHDMSNNFQLLYVKDYYKDHPDWFYMTDEWKQKADQFATMSDDDFYVCAQKYSQLCYTQGYYDNSEGGMFDTYVENLIGYIKNEPDAKLFMLGMGDNHLVCDCERCQRDIEKYKVSGVTLRFVNKVAKAVNEWLRTESGMPDRKIYLVMFAYLTAMEAPVRYVNRVAQPIDESVVAEDNVCIRIAPLEDANFYWKLNDETHNTFMAKMLQEWQLCAEHFAIWDYRVFYSGLFAPYPCWNTVKGNLEIYKSMDVLSVMHQGYENVRTPFNKLDDYVRSRLLYDLSLDVGELVDEFIDAYYKEAAPYIREYIALLQMHYENYMVAEGFSGSVYSDIYSQKFWPLDVLVKIEDIFKKAYECIAKLPEAEQITIRNRVDYESRFYRYAMIEIYHDSFTKAELAEMIENFNAANTTEPLTEYSVRQYMEDKLENWMTYLE